MIKKSAFFLLFVTAIALAAAGSSFAAASLNAGNTTLAAELISPTVPFPAGNVQTAYQPSIGIAATQVLSVTLGGAKFDPAGGPTIAICDPAAPPPGIVGSGPISADGTKADVLLLLPLSNGTAYSLTNGPCAPVGFPPTPINNIAIPAGTGAGTTITMTIDSANSPNDPNIFATAPVITVLNQFTAQLTPVTSKLAFTPPPTGSNFVPDVPAATKAPATPTNLRSDAAIVILSNETINSKVVLDPGAGPCQRTTATAGGTYKFTVAGDLAGLNQVSFGTFANPVAGNVAAITAADRAAKEVTLSLTGAQVLICGVGGIVFNDTPLVQNVLELQALGTTAMAAGIRTATLSLTGAPGQTIKAAERKLIPATGVLPETSHIFRLDSKQYYIPLVKVNQPAFETYIKFQSKSALTGSNDVVVDILASDGSMVSFPAGSITSGTPLLITGTQLKDAVTAAGKSVDGAAGFAAIVNVNSQEADIFPYANTCVPGAEFCRRIPVKTVGGTIVE